LKRLSLLGICLVISIVFLGLPLKAEIKNEPVLSPKEAVTVVDYSSGVALFAKNQDVKLPPASLTKLMTALLTIERAKPSDIVTVGNEVLGLEGTQVRLAPGDRISVESLVYGLLLESGNDAANVLAVYISGSTDKFAQIMNERARSLGMINTNFINPHGLPAVNHQSTARDLGILARAAVQNNFIKSVVGTTKKEITWERKNGGRVQLQLENTNKLLSVYPGVNGMKTGTSIEAGQCLITYAQWEVGKVIIVLLNSANRYQDTTYWLDQTYRTLQVKRAGNLLVGNSWLSF